MITCASYARVVKSMKGGAAWDSLVTVGAHGRNEPYLTICLFLMYLFSISSLLYPKSIYNSRTALFSLIKIIHQVFFEGFLSVDYHTGNKKVGKEV